MRIKKLLQVFLGSWAVLIFLAVLTGAGELTPAAQVGCTGVLAALITLLALLATRGEKKKCFHVVKADSGELCCRVEGEWAYEGRDEKASWYIKRGALYNFESMKPLYRWKNGLVTREGDATPCLRVEGERIVSCESGETVWKLVP